MDTEQSRAQQQAHRIAKTHGSKPPTERPAGLYVFFHHGRSILNSSSTKRQELHPNGDGGALHSRPMRISHVCVLQQYNIALSTLQVTRSLSVCTRRNDPRLVFSYPHAVTEERKNSLTHRGPVSPATSAHEPGDVPGDFPFGL